MYTDPGNTNTWQEANTVDFCPTAVLATTTTFNDTVWAINSGIDLALVSTGTYALVDNEFVAITAISASSITVLRGVLDTVPAVHTSGARLFFMEDTCETDGVEYATGETARIRLLPTTGRGTLAIDSATTQSRTLSGRQARPTTNRPRRSHLVGQVQQCKIIPLSFVDAMHQLRSPCRRGSSMGVFLGV